MPRKLKKLETGPIENTPVMENPATMPAAKKELMSKSRKNALEAEADKLATEERTAARDERAVESIRKQMNESNEDRTNPGAVFEARREAAKKTQEEQIAQSGLSQSQFLKMLESYPLEEQTERFSGTKNFFRRLAGQAWAGKNPAELNALMKRYTEAESIMNEDKNKALRQMQDAPSSRPTRSGNMPTRGDNAELVNNTPMEMDKPVAANLESRNEELAISFDDAVNHQAQLEAAYNELLTKDKKSANILLQTVARARYEKFGSTLGTEDEQSTTASKTKRGGSQTGGFIPGTQISGKVGSASGALYDQLQKLDTQFINEETPNAYKEAAKETVEEAEWTNAINKAKAKLAKTEVAKPVVTSTKTETIDSPVDQRNEQQDREVAWLAAFSKEDAAKAYKLMVPDASAATLKAVTARAMADTYRAMATEEQMIEAKTKSRVTKADKERLKAVKAQLAAVKAFAATVTVELTEEDLLDVEDSEETKMAQVSAQGREEMTAFEARKAENDAKQARLKEQDRQEAQKTAKAVRSRAVPPLAKSLQGTIKPRSNKKAG
ncbi:MAG: hypothetical protein KC582_00665 [Candidatus Magasanikbacteria bacterium]|nr:hypothetical protein [Candidatus Magasanikbacteria bacterium]MCA9390754.1 hypothetical protein [Candidatus Magasanikbacteria bacterium]USN52259.1 MAG: hypothetical protein H6759_04525 [Candidatus Nomurabacteria bacterium]HPF95199.1 hypothetical protein [bacterium]